MEKGAIGGRRVESPSSMNTYFQCPRKYYYSYILKLRSDPNIYQIRGNVVHSALEDFFKLEINEVEESEFYDVFRLRLIELFNKHWVTALGKLMKINMSKEEIKKYYVESLDMLNNFLYRFCTKIDKEMKVLSLSEAFNKLKPIAEMRYFSQEYKVQGYIDAIHEIDGEISLWDYKTSKRDKMSDEYYLQLGIYAMMYYEKHKVYPKKVGVDFLLHGERAIEVDEKLISNAKEKCVKIHSSTSSNDIKDYPQNITGLCKWKTGQCDHYDACFGQKKLGDFSVNKPASCSVDPKKTI